jgi:hypothetical protein
MMLTMMVGSVVQAAGFDCIGNDTSTVISTREASKKHAAFMSIDDPKVKTASKQNIAEFYDGNGLNINKSGNVFDGDAGLAKELRKGENIAGTKLGELSLIRLTVLYKHGDATYSGEAFAGTIRYTKKSGEVRTENANCFRTKLTKSKTDQFYDEYYN